MSSVRILEFLLAVTITVLAQAGLAAESSGPSLAEQARVESLQPYHTLSAADASQRYQQPWPGGYSYMTHVLRRRMIWPYTGFSRPVWAATGARAIYPPWFDFQTVPGAARYRISVWPSTPPRPLPALSIERPDPALAVGAGLPVTTLGDGPVTLTNLLVLVPSLPSAPALFEALDPLGGGAKTRIAPGRQLAGPTNRVFQALTADWLAGGTIAADKIPGAQASGRNVFRSLCLAGALACPSNQVIRITIKEGWPHRFWLDGRPVSAGQEIKLGPGTYPLTVIVGSDAERIPTTVSLVVERSTEPNWQKAADALAAWQVRNKPAVEFEATSPSTPLTPVWGQLPPGGYRILATGLDSNGMVLGPAKTVSTHPFDPAGESYGFAKVAPWSGPVTNPPSAAVVAQAAEDLIRWRWSDPGQLNMATQLSWVQVLRHPTGDLAFAQSLTYGGDNLSLPYAVGAGGHMAYAMLLRATPAALDRAQWQEIANRTQMLLEGTASKGFTGYYKDHHFLKHVFGEALLDLYAVTKQERLAEMARALAKQLAESQTPEGAWKGAGRDLPLSNPAELLYFFGRLRRDLGVRDYVEVEKKAHAWLQANSLRTMFWPAQGHHSYTLHHPLTPAPRCALYYAQYLLECAPAELKDPALVRQLLQYAEDQHLTWHPRVSFWGMSRDDLDPRAGLALLAKCYLLADQQFGRPLDKAKAETLLAHLVATTPKPGTSVPADPWDWAQPQTARYLLDCSRLLETPKQ